MSSTPASQDWRNPVTRSVALYSSPSSNSSSTTPTSEASSVNGSIPESGISPPVPKARPPSR